MKKKKDYEILKLFSVVFLMIIIALAFGYFVRSQTRPKQEIEYSNGFKFTKVGSFWYTSIQNPLVKQEYNLDFRYSPSEIKDIPVEGNPDSFFRLLEKNNLTGAYFTFNPSGNLTAVNLAAADLSKLLKVLNDVTLVAACTVNSTEACSTRPIVTCENQENLSVVIYVKQDPTPKITMNKNCLTIQGQGEGLIKAYTKLLFIWYSIL